MTENLNGRENNSRDDLAADSEQALGEALGRAIGDHLDAAAPPGTAPMAAIVDLAAARARVRTTRRAVAAVAASVAIVAGGVVGWNALRRDATTTVFVTSGDRSTPSTPTAPVSGEAESAPRAAAQERATGIDTGTEEDDSNQLVSAAPTPEDLSTGPVLEWTEIDPGFADLFNFESTDGGRVLARAWGIGDELVIDGERAVFTDNGIDWTEFPLPDGIVIRRIDISGDRWLAWGRPRSSDDPREVIDRVFFTDDRGVNWNEVLLQVPPDPELTSPYCERHLSVRSALTSGQGIVLEVGGYTTLDAQGLLADRGLLPDGRSVRDWRPGEEGTVVFEFLRRFGFEPGVDPEVADSEPGELRFTHEELGFTGEELASLCLEVTPMRLLWSNGSTVEPADGPADPSGDRSAFDMDVVDDVLRVQRVANGSPASTTATFEGLHPTGVRAAGSAGVVATAFPSLDGQLEASTIGGLPRWRDRNRSGELPGVPLWLGWSADGTDWGWQSLPDAFGIAEGEPWAQLAVGRDFVMARVETIVAPTPEELALWSESEAAYQESLTLEAPPLRWFIARVP